MTENLLFVMGLWEVLENIPTIEHVKLPGVGSRPGNKLRVFALGRLCVMRVEKLVILNLNIEVRIFKAFSF